MTHYQTLIFLHHDERWANLRTNMFLSYGTRYTPLIFAIIITFICPILFGLKNLLLGLSISGDFGIESAKHIIKSMRQQLVVLYNIKLYESKADKEKTIYTSCIIGYFLYVLPIGFFGFLFLFYGSTNSTCREMKVPFLLDNNFQPAVNMTEMYEMRRTLYDRTSYRNYRKWVGKLRNLSWWHLSVRK